MIGGSGPIMIRGMGPDSSVTRQLVKPGTAKRILPYIRPYRLSIGFLLVVTTANGDRETITVTETGINTGIFRSGAITTNTSSVAQGNSALNVVAGTGLHVAYYQIKTTAGISTLDVRVSNSTNGKGFSSQRVTSQSFPGVYTLPQFDPLIAFTYMGDYIANVSDGTHQYMAWGDNRDIVVNFMWPSGRHDPDVFFARQ